jgi:short-subunit dehydrogenase
MAALSFLQKYGPWALVAGASEGLGAAFAENLAAQGIKLVLVARREDKLREVAQNITNAYGVATKTVVADLSDAGQLQKIVDAVAAVELGLVVYNAAYAPIGKVLDQELSTLENAVSVNVLGPVRIVHALAPRLVAQGRGGIVLMSSLAGLQGTPRLATYAGSKAFNIVFGESLWGELREAGVDVVVSCAGAIRTPGYASASQAKDAPGTLDAEVVAQQTLAALGKCPRVVPGWINTLAQWLVGRLLPRKTAIKIMDNNTKDLA